MCARDARLNARNSQYRCSARSIGATLAVGRSVAVNAVERSERRETQ